jgi:hypothetical protein
VKGGERKRSNDKYREGEDGREIEREVGVRKREKELAVEIDREGVQKREGGV